MKFATVCLLILTATAFALDCSDEDMDQITDDIRACLGRPMSYDAFEKCLEGRGIDVSSTCSHCLFTVATLINKCIQTCDQDRMSPECQHCDEEIQEAASKCVPMQAFGLSNPFQAFFQVSLKETVVITVDPKCNDDDMDALTNVDEQTIQACLARPMAYDKFHQCLEKHGISLTDDCSHCIYTGVQMAQACRKSCSDPTSAECQSCLEEAQKQLQTCVGEMLANPFARLDLTPSFLSFTVELM